MSAGVHRLHSIEAILRGFTRRRSRFEKEERLLHLFYDHGLLIVSRSFKRFSGRYATWRPPPRVSGGP